MEVEPIGFYDSDQGANRRPPFGPSRGCFSIESDTRSSHGRSGVQGAGAGSHHSIRSGLNRHELFEIKAPKP